MNIFQQTFLYVLLKKDEIQRKEISEFNTIQNSTEHNKFEIITQRYRLQSMRRISPDGVKKYGFYIENYGLSGLPYRYMNEGIFAKNIYAMYADKMKNWNKQK